MNPEKAIDVLAPFLATRVRPSEQTLDEALHLGIEALKLNLTMRETYLAPQLLHLPSETQEDHETREHEATNQEGD